MVAHGLATNQRKEQTMINLRIVLLCLILIAAKSAHAYTGTACAVQCTGEKPVTPYDFWKKAQQAGDPNGGALGSSMQAPSDPNNPNGPTESVPTKEYFDSLNGFEDWSAKNCGVSLADENSPDEVLVSQDCNSSKMLNRKLLVVIGMHKPTGTPPPSLSVINTFFDAVTSPQGQKKYAETLYYQPESGTKNLLSCDESKPEIGDDNFNAFVRSKQCRNVFIPGTPKMIVQKSLPAGFFTRTISEVEAGFTIFGKTFSPLKVSGVYHAPNSGLVSASHTVTSFGIQLAGENYSGKAGANKISVEKVFPVAEVSGGGEATFFIGPVPLSVSAYAHGTMSASGLAKVAPVWANGSVGQTLDSWVDADASVNLFIVKAGVEGKITLIKDSLYAYGFMGIAPVPTTYNGQTMDMFKLSSQSTSFDDFHALGGTIKIYAKIRRPKWLGWKWKKYSHNIISWNGAHATGYLFSNTSGPVDIPQLLK